MVRLYISRILSALLSNNMQQALFCFTPVSQPAQSAHVYADV